MAITTLDQLTAALASSQRFNLYKISASTEGAGTFHSLLRVTGRPNAGNIPASGAGEIYTSASNGALPISLPENGKKLYLGRTAFSGSTVSSIIVYDRLWANSGLVGNIVTDQTVDSLPLTRYTDGIGIEMWGEIYSTMGATTSTLNVTYVDSNNDTRVGTYAHPNNALSVGQMFPITPDQAGHGCKSITKCAFTISTGTAGNFGLVILRKLIEIPLLSANITSAYDAFELALPEILPNAALYLKVLCTANNTGNIFGSVDIISG